MPIQASTLRPGLLISLKTSVTGNVSYQKLDIEFDHLTADGELKARWETEKTVTDPAEYEAAIKVRSKCRSLITSVCSRSSFGLLCPEDKKYRLDDAVTEAQRLASEFNLGAVRTRIGVYIIAGRVAQDDVSAIQAINSEVRDLLDTMESGLQRLDVSIVRDAAKRAKELGEMLSPSAGERIQEAISAARSAARKIVKAAETGAEEIDTATIAKIRQSRGAFLDLGEETEVLAPDHTARAIDLDPEVEMSDDGTLPAPPASITLPQIDLTEDDGEEHSNLCDCEVCNAQYGDLPVSIAARSIEFD